MRPEGHHHPGFPTAAHNRRGPRGRTAAARSVDRGYFAGRPACRRGRRSSCGTCARRGVARCSAFSTVGRRCGCAALAGSGLGAWQGASARTEDGRSTRWLQNRHPAPLLQIARTLGKLEDRCRQRGVSGGGLDAWRPHSSSARVTFRPPASCSSSSSFTALRCASHSVNAGTQERAHHNVSMQDAELQGYSPPAPAFTATASAFRRTARQISPH